MRTPDVACALRPLPAFILLFAMAIAACDRIMSAPIDHRDHGD